MAALLSAGQFFICHLRELLLDTLLDALALDVVFLFFQHRGQLAHPVGEIGVGRVPLALAFEGDARIGGLQVRYAPTFFLNSFDYLHESIGIPEGVAIDVRPHQLKEGILSLQQFEPGATDAAHLTLI